jgi:hypothetical protein
MPIQKLVDTIASRPDAANIDLNSDGGTTRISVAFDASRDAMQRRLQDLASIAQQAGLIVRAAYVAALVATIEV